MESERVVASAELVPVPDVRQSTPAGGEGAERDGKGVRDDEIRVDLLQEPAHPAKGADVPSSRAGGLASEP